MKLWNVLLSVVVVAVGSFAVFYFYSMEVPVAAEEHGEEDGHGDEKEAAHGDESGGHGHEDAAQHAEIDDAKAKEHGLKFETAAAGDLQVGLSLPGEIALDESSVVHVVPRLTGVATQVLKKLGDKVTKSELLARIESRELADVKSALLTAVERRGLAQTRFAREKELFDKRISPAEDYLSAKQSLAEEDINIRAAAQKLQALGFTPDEIKAVQSGRDKTLTDYALLSPIDGTIIEKHLNTGEFVEEQADTFVIADLGRVWASVVVYVADLKSIHEGQSVTVRSQDLDTEATGKVAYIGALVGEKTRTAKAIVELPNPDGLWRPGLFVNVAIAQEIVPVKVAVPSVALQTMKEQHVVFVREGDGLESRPVTVGRSDGKLVEIVSGLEPGETYVTENSFLVKADIEKAGAAHEH